MINFFLKTDILSNKMQTMTISGAQTMTTHTNDFSFDTAPRIVCRQGASNLLGELLRAMGVSHAFVVTDTYLLSSGLLKPAQEGLAAAGLRCTVFSEVQADPPEACVLAAVEVARAAGADGVVGLGGGSSLDTAKLVALLLRSPARLDDIYGVDKVTGARLPLIQVPTTAGTGSEVTPIAILTTPSAEKKGVVSRVLLPDVALLDSNLTLGMPARLTAMTGIDAMVHAIEAYTSEIKKNPVSDALALRALKLLVDHIEVVLAQPAHADARQAMLLGSLLAGMAFANAPVGAVHALAYPLGGRFHVPHGLSNALMLAPVLHFNLSHASDHYAELAQAIGLKANDTVALAQAFVDHIAGLVARMPFEQSLPDVGVTTADIEGLAQDAMNVQRLLVNNPREVTLDDARALYQQAFG